MVRGVEQKGSVPENNQFNRECFDLGRQVALRGVPAVPEEHWGNQDKTTFIGEYQGKKYGVEYSVSHYQDGRNYHTVTLMGRDLYTTFTTETPKGHQEGSVFYSSRDINFGNQDPMTILANITTLTEATMKPKSVEKELGTAFRLDDKDGLGGFIVVAKDEEAAAAKYLDWCEANNDFHSILIFRISQRFTKCVLLS
jgi:hypothetical protein